MRSLILFFTIVFILNLNSYCQDWKWATGFGNTTGTTIVNSSFLKSDNSIILCGAFGSTTLDIGGHSLSGSDRNDIYIAEYSLTGDCNWAISFGGNSDDVANCIVSDDNGNIYVAGNFESPTISFGTHTITNSGDKDAFVIKLNSARQVVWATKIGTIYSDAITAMSIDNNHNIYISGSQIDYNLWLEEIFVSEIDQNSGSILWTKKGLPEPGGFTNGAKINAMTCDNENNIYIAGEFFHKLYFGTNVIVSSLTYWGDHAENAFVIKFDDSGNYMAGNAIADFKKATGIIDYNQDIFIAGDSIEWGVGWGWPLSRSKIYLSKYNNNLNRIWMQSSGGLTFSQSLDISKSIGVDNSGNVYQTGSFMGEGLKFGEDSLPNFFNQDYYQRQIFIFKYDNEGNPIWAKSAGGLHCDIPTKINVIGNDNFYISGVFESASISFDDYSVENPGEIQYEWVHMSPEREFRNSYVFLANYGDFSSNICSNTSGTSFDIYPNPTDNKLYIQSNFSESREFEISIYSPDGKILKKHHFNNSDSKIEVDLDPFASGMYLLLISDQNGSTTHKVFKK